MHHLPDCEVLTLRRGDDTATIAVNECGMVATQRGADVVCHTTIWSAIAWLESDGYSIDTEAWRAV